RVLHRRALAAAEESERAALEATLAAQHRRDEGSVDAAVAAGIVDEVIAPARTRTAVARAIAEALTDPPTRGRHTNMPL
ncbi:MAG TPA: acyl-CoA carboxylase subunit beta, partial [Nonomuraea sp.]|nr:acyl-CoA carboxylase subunit beta [Nonomuraea sp.]